MTSAYAIYRLPGSDECVFLGQTEGSPERLDRCEQLDGRHGFVFAPFSPSAEEPLLLIRPDVVKTMKAADIEAVQPSSELRLATPDEEERTEYAADFAAFHDSLTHGRFSKLVLARRSRLVCSTDVQAEYLFKRACRMYPRLFVALVSIPSAGQWLMATPEILIDGTPQSYRTIALAGTMLYREGITECAIGDVWTRKNIDEQHVVVSYLSDSLSTLTPHITVTGPYTARAAGLVHLRSDFDFTLPDTSKLGDVIARLHPTPAVCGMPKDEARRFIIGHEHFPRHYYSGFSGMLGTDGSAHLYVSLRCMHIRSREYDLYAGGGLLTDSVENDEWQETEAKLETMKRLFDI